jgi:hypothetical protein
MAWAAHGLGGPWPGQVHGLGRFMAGAQEVGCGTPVGWQDDRWPEQDPWGRHRWDGADGYAGASRLSGYVRHVP